MIKFILRNFSPFIVILGLVLLFDSKQILEFGQEHRGLLYLCVIGAAFIISFLPTIISKLHRPKYIKNITLDDASFEFKKIYDSLYSSNIEELEELRKKAKTRRIIQIFLLAIMFIGYIFMKSSRTIISFTVDSIIGIIAIIAFVIWGIFIYMNHKSKNEYKLLYKNNIVSRFVKLVNDSLTYTPNSEKNGPLSNEYRNANFDNKSFNNFFNDDSIEGYIEDNIYIKADDIRVEKVYGGGKYESTDELFKGIFAFTKTNKSINSFIKISRNKYNIFNNDYKVQMDDSTFEKYFDVYSEDKLLAMRLLTSDIMTSLMDFYRKYELEFEIMFKNDTIYLRFFTGEMFEPKLFGNSMDEELLLVYYEILKLIVDITKKANITLQEIEI